MFGIYGYVMPCMILFDRNCITCAQMVMHSHCGSLPHMKQQKIDGR